MSDGEDLKSYYVTTWHEMLSAILGWTEQQIVSASQLALVLPVMRRVARVVPRLPAHSAGGSSVGPWLADRSDLTEQSLRACVDQPAQK